MYRKTPFYLISTVFIDLLGIGIMVPLFAPMILNVNSLLLPASTPFETRSIVLGFLLATYSLIQFFGAPFLGSISDRFGRKKILSLSLFGTMIGAFVTAFGIYSNNIFIVFLGRIIDGFTGGNTLIVYSSIADTTHERYRSANFGIIAMAFGLGFLIGPVIGGILSNSQIISWFSFYVPFIFTGFLTGINLCLVQLFFKETLKTPRNVKFDLLLGIKNLKKLYHMKNLRTILFVEFLLAFGLNFFIQFYQVFLIKKYGFDQTDIGYLFGYIGLWVAFTQGFINPLVVKKLHSYQILKFSPIMLSILFPFLIIFDDPKWIYLVVPIAAIFQGLNHPNAGAVISAEAKEGHQGEILGISQSVSSIAYSIPPIISGFLVSFNINLPTILASILTFSAWIIYINYFKPSKIDDRDNIPEISIG